MSGINQTRRRWWWAWGLGFVFQKVGPVCGELPGPSGKRFLLSPEPGELAGDSHDVLGLPWTDPEQARVGLASPRPPKHCRGTFPAPSTYPQSRVTALCPKDSARAGQRSVAVVSLLLPIALNAGHLVDGQSTGWGTLSRPNHGVLLSLPVIPGLHLSPAPTAPLKGTLGISLSCLGSGLRTGAT